MALLLFLVHINQLCQRERKTEEMRATIQKHPPALTASSAGANQSISSSSQGINESANFRFLQRLPSYMASAETVRDLFPAETTVHENWLPAETVRVILLPAETLGRKLNRLRRKPFTKYISLGRKQEIADSLGGSQI